MNVPTLCDRAETALSSLTGAAIWLWIATRHTDLIDDLPLILFPLALLRFRTHDAVEAKPSTPFEVACGVLLMLAGLNGESGLITTIGWMLLARPELVRSGLLPGRRLVSTGGLIILLSFPWIRTDLPELGLFMRTSAARSAHGLSQLIGGAGERVGTTLEIPGLRLEIDDTCSGTRSLQLYLALGVFLAWRTARFTPATGLMSAAALTWSANVGRVILLTLLLPAAPVPWRHALHDLIGISCQLAPGLALIGAAIGRGRSIGPTTFEGSMEVLHVP